MGAIKQASLSKKGGFWSELLGTGVTHLGAGALGTAVGGPIGGAGAQAASLGIPALIALFTKTRNTRDQATADQSIAKNFIPGMGMYQGTKRLGYSIRNPELRREQGVLRQEDAQKDLDKEKKKNEGE